MTAFGKILNAIIAAPAVGVIAMAGLAAFDAAAPEKPLAAISDAALPSVRHDRMVQREIKAFRAAFRGIDVEEEAGGGSYGNALLSSDQPQGEFPAWSRYDTPRTGAEALKVNRYGGRCKIASGDPDADLGELWNPKLSYLGRDGKPYSRPSLNVALIERVWFDEWVVRHELGHCADLADPKRRGAAEIDREMVGDVYAALHHLADGRPLQSLELWAHWRHLNLAVGYPGKGDDGKAVVKYDSAHWTSAALNQVVLDMKAGRIDPKAMSKKEMLGYARTVSGNFMIGYFGKGDAPVNAANPLVAWYDGVVWTRVARDVAK